MTNSAVQQVFAFPASFAQERLWLLAQIEPSDPAYHITGAVRFKGDLNLHALQASLNEVVKRQESLRTTFREVNGEIEQIISPSSTIDLEVVPSEIPHGVDAEASFDSWLAVILEEPFDLVRGPLLRVVLWKHAGDDHTMILVVHHIISDGWSLMVLIREVTELYRAFVAGTAPQLPALSIQYADYTLWQRKWVSEEKLEADLSYWKSRLDGLPVLDLPTDYWRPSTQQHRGGRQSLRLSSALSAALIEFSQREQTTLFITLLTGFKVLLHRYSGGQDIVVGTPVAGRKRCELEPLIGCFLNTLVLRTEIPENASFRQVLRQVRETALDAYSHEDTPFEKVQEAVNPQRTLSRTSLFQVFVNMLSLPEPMAVELPGVKAEMVELPEGSSKFDLTLYIYFQHGKVDLSLVYNAGLFLPERIAEMAWQFEYLLEQAVGCPEQLVSKFSLVGPQTRLVAPDPRAPLDSKFEGAVHELFRSWAESSPHQLAVADPDVNWSYMHLERLSNRLANYLLSIDIRRGDVIAIYAHRSAPLVVALLGIMKAGGAFLILDPEYPTARLVGYLQSAKPKALLELESAGAVPTEVKGWAGTSDCARFMLPSSSRTDFDSVLQDFPASAPVVSVGADDLACISFTSGSTGIPKGVMGCHGSLSHFTPWTAERFGLRQSDRFSMFSALSHYPLQRDVYTPLMIGASVFIPHPEDWKLPGKAVEWMRQNEISICNLTPSLSQLITYENTECSLNSLRYVFFVGEALSLHDVSRLYELAPSARCVNYFGTTETQRALSFFEIPRSAISSNGAGMLRAKDTVPLGRGIKDVQLLVLNQAQQLAGIGELGEIYIRSPHLARGYSENPKLTTVKFLLNPFTGIDGDRVYRTGDLGRYLPDGSVEFAERGDGQMKVRGFRVELGEIEARLRSHPLVRGAAAALRAHPSGSKQLVGYVVLNQEQAGWQRALHMWLAEQLPDYMAPGTFVMMDGLPLTPAGKVDRKALPAPDYQNIEGSQQISPRNVEEEMLQVIFAEVLKLERMGVEQNFFQAGGHSLLATQVMSRVRSAMGVEVPLRALFESPTVAGLAEWLRRARRAGLLAQPPLAPVERRTDLPLSYAQQRLWFLDRFTSGSAAYNMSFGLRLKGELNREGLGWSFNELVKRHEVLRTVFVEREGGPAQAIAEELNLRIEEIDLRGWQEREREVETERIVWEEVATPFDLGRGPLLRVKLLRIGEQEHGLLVTLHHIVFDGWSVEITVREIAYFYEAYVKGEKPKLPELPVQYADYAMWQRGWLQGEALEQQIGYWKKQLEGVAVLELPANRRPGMLETEAGKSVPWSFSEELGRELMGLGRRQSATLFMTLLAGFQVLLVALQRTE